MQFIIEEFESKKKEIDLFYDLLVAMDSRELVVNEEILDREIHEILKASFFLMLYNLVESTMRDSIKSIYEHIESNGIDFNSLRSRLRRLILKDCKHKIGLSTLYDGTCNNIARELMQVSLDEKNLFSGNIDSDVVKDFANKYGFSYSTDPNKTKRGEKLLTIKDNRNDLAHGNKTFSNIGRNYDVGLLKEYKDETLEYLNKIIANINYYLRNERYLNSSNG